MGTEREPRTDPGFTSLRAAVRDVLGLDLEAYRGPQLLRRLAFFRERHGLAGDAELALRLRLDAELRRRFAEFFTINVSEFFRNPERFAELRDRFLPELLAGGRGLRVWSAGCSIGAELHSVALLLAEQAPGRLHTLLGTDIDEACLERARAAVYQEGELRQVPPELRRRWFREVPGGWELAPAVRAQARFRRHDLLRDPYPAGWDLILCRNVVIYFTEEAKAAVWERLAASLSPGGVLFVGASEIVHGARRLGLEVAGPGFYRRTAGARPGEGSGAAAAGR